MHAFTLVIQMYALSRLSTAATRHVSYSVTQWFHLTFLAYSYVLVRAFSSPFLHFCVSSRTDILVATKTSSAIGFSIVSSTRRFFPLFFSLRSRICLTGCRFCSLFVVIGGICGYLVIFACSRNTASRRNGGKS